MTADWTKRPTRAQRSDDLRVLDLLEELLRGTG
jgi:hypothetical protein